MRCSNLPLPSFAPCLPRQEHLLGSFFFFSTFPWVPQPFSTCSMEVERIKAAMFTQHTRFLWVLTFDLASGRSGVTFQVWLESWAPLPVSVQAVSDTSHHPGAPLIIFQHVLLFRMLLQSVMLINISKGRTEENFRIILTCGFLSAISLLFHKCYTSKNVMSLKDILKLTGPPYPQVPQLRIQSVTDQKYFLKNATLLLTCTL